MHVGLCIGAGRIENTDECSESIRACVEVRHPILALISQFYLHAYRRLSSIAVLLMVSIVSNIRLGNFPFSSSFTHGLTIYYS